MSARKRSPKPAQSQQKQRSENDHLLKPLIMPFILVGIAFLFYCLIQLFVNWIGGDMERHNAPKVHYTAEECQQPEFRDFHACKLPSNYDDWLMGFWHYTLFWILMVPVATFLFLRAIKIWRDSKNKK